MKLGRLLVQKRKKVEVRHCWVADLYVAGVPR
jgi:hypothetical protein